MGCKGGSDIRGKAYARGITDARDETDASSHISSSSKCQPNADTRDGNTTAASEPIKSPHVPGSGSGA